MAQMPRGEPRSVPDPVGDQYDEMLRQERMKSQRAESVLSDVQTGRSDWPFPFNGPNFHDESPGPNPVVTIGGQRYREVDNGKAGVLVDADDPVQAAQRREALDRVGMMTQSPLGGAAYGIASLFNAPSGVRDGALAGGAAADAMIQSLAPFGPVARGRIAGPPQQAPVRPLNQDPIRYADLNSEGQAMGASARITRSMLGTGTKAPERLTPPGWQGKPKRRNEARGHLLANQLGGEGIPKNIVTQTHYGSNTPQMRDFETEIAKRVRRGEVVDYSSVPLYGGNLLPPSAILVTATGSRSPPAARLFLNPAGQSK
jgi:hypothetical protein